MFGPCASCSNRKLGEFRAYCDTSMRCITTGVSVYFNIRQKIEEIKPIILIRQEELDQLAIECLEDLGVGCLKWALDRS